MTKIRIKGDVIEADPMSVGASKGWLTKWRNRAMFWEAEAKRLGSTAQYNMKNHSKWGTAALDWATGEVIDPVTAERVKRQPVQMTMAERFGQEPEEPEEPEETIATRYGISAADLAAAYGVAASDPEGRNVPQLASKCEVFRVEHGDPVGQECMVNGQHGTIVRALRNKPGAVHPYMAFKVFLDDGTTVTESASKVYRV